MNLFLEIDNYCELKCRFCVADNSHSYEATNISINLIKDLVDKYRHGEKNCAFITGGEPLLHPQLFDILSLLRQENYYIYITTNGLHLGIPEFIVKLMSYGIERLAIPIYGSEASHHDAMTGVPGSFDKLISGLDNLFYIKDKHNVNTKVELRLLMSKFTNEDNIEIVDMIASKYPSVDYITILGLQLSTQTTNYEEMIETSLTESKECLQRTIDRIWEHGIKATQTGIPICILGEKYKKIYHGQFENNNEATSKRHLSLFPHLSVAPYMTDLTQTLFREKTSKQKSYVCNKCRYVRMCDGLQVRYVKRYGFADIKPIV